MSVERVIASMRRDFLLDLSDGFVYDCLDWQVRRLDLVDHRRWVLEHFSGTLCVDELHLGKTTLLLATDPLNDLPVAFALVGSNDRPHMRRFLQNLKIWGLARGGDHRRVEPVPGRPGRTVAGRPPPTVRLSRPEGPP